VGGRAARRLGTGLAVVAALLVLTAAPAAAHATPVTESPRPGATLPQAPGYAVIRFSEAVDVHRSAIAVSGAHERDATAGPTTAVADDRNALRRPLRLLPPGRYVVRWTSVSLDDGHLESGSYSFSIGVAADRATSTAVGLLAGAGGIGFAGHLVGTTGLVLWAGLVLVRRRAEGTGLRPDRAIRMIGLGSSAAVLGSLVAAVDRAIGSAAGAGAFTDGTNAQLQTAVLVAVLAAWISSRLGPSRAFAARLGGAALAVAIAAEAASGHRAAGALPGVASAVIAVHLVAVGIWLAAIACSLVSSRRATTLRAMSRPAVGAAAAVLASGVAAALVEIRSPSELTGTRYGLFVVAKSAAFLAVAGVGAYHWARRRRRATNRQLRRPLAVEGLLAAATIVLGTLLAAAPPPARATVAQATSPAGVRSDSDAASVAAATGPYVVALTISPPRPGPVGLAVRILGAAPGAMVRQVEVEGRAEAANQPAFRTALRPGPDDTFTGRTRLAKRGTWAIAVDAVVGNAPVHVALELPVPTASGTGLLARAIATEGRLRSALLHEVVRDRTDGPGVVADYTFRAPDAIEFTVEGSTEVDIGRRTYRRERADGPWSAEGTDAPVAWPDPYFRQFWAHATGVRVLGTEVVDGVASHVVAFERPDLPAWFRIWVGGDGLVRREEMLAEHHLMVHTYSAFDDAPAITAPIIGPMIATPMP
jgi:copper transport protein